MGFIEVLGAMVLIRLAMQKASQARQRCLDEEAELARLQRLVGQHGKGLAG